MRYSPTGSAPSACSGTRWTLLMKWTTPFSNVRGLWANGTHERTGNSLTLPSTLDRVETNFLLINVSDSSNIARGDMRQSDQAPTGVVTWP